MSLTFCHIVDTFLDPPHSEEKHLTPPSSQKGEGLLLVGGGEGVTKPHNSYVERLKNHYSTVTCHIALISTILFCIF